MRGLGVPVSGRGMLCNLCIKEFSVADWSNGSPEKGCCLSFR